MYRAFSVLFSFLFPASSHRQVQGIPCIVANSNIRYDLGDPPPPPPYTFTEWLEALHLSYFIWKFRSLAVIHLIYHFPLMHNTSELIKEAMNLPFVALTHSHLQDTLILLRLLVWDSSWNISFLTLRVIMLSPRTSLAFEGPPRTSFTRAPCIQFLVMCSHLWHQG